MYLNCMLGTNKNVEMKFKFVQNVLKMCSAFSDTHSPRYPAMAASQILSVCPCAACAAVSYLVSNNFAFLSSFSADCPCQSWQCLHVHLYTLSTLHVYI